MAASRPNYPHAGLKVAVLTVAFIISYIKSGQNYCASDHDRRLFQRKMVLGSKPPACVNKCLSCRPCVATFVIPSNQRKFKGLRASLSSHGEDDTYYLLSWKCRCGNKLFQP